jgi:DedD protein
VRILSEHEQQPQSTNRPTSRVRQRLVGGLVVLALAVLLLPLWLDGGGLKTPSVQPVPKAPTIEQPAQITVPAPPPAQQQLLEHPPASQVPETEPEPSDVKASPTEKAEPKVETPASQPAPTVSRAPAPAVVHEPSKPVAAPTAPITSAPATPPKQTASKDKPTSSTSSASGNQLWVVQLGSFSDELNAKGLAHSVSDSGFKVEITPLFAKKGTVWRVRVGPYASRELAVKATTRLREKLGRDGLVMPK